ncbi:hypothetical protein BJN34_35415 (plasmid) [Cupriavidus necator]|uniref:Glucose-methanol-choline oxidoreductase N-terminal domain-containing protein n=1 Tax=Cupriavidus necator TaxID=106590 RepID=A0A1U9V3E5_CUPNE|nr:GMC family oxidoreductase N-terminal domain-containing protein [Cupriavidus necator]AQV99167.1 hypothetical protein BJN34_35415 [Cupriavidus necator]
MTASLEFDFIVVGAGSAGSIVASRLSESGRYTVLVLEAGGWDRNPWIHIPLGVGKTIMNKAVNWTYHTEPVPQLFDRRLYMARGKVVGGCGAINGMVHVRGQPQDFEQWRESGCDGWGWSDVLPYFKRSEDHYLGETDLHGKGGPVAVSRPRGHSVLCDHFIAAGVNFGLERNDDFNGIRQDGVGLYDHTVRRGLRSNSAIGALRPAKRRGNVRVEVGAHVERIVFDSGRAVGINFRKAGATLRQAHARREVILCAGAINTPQLLMLSGIGPQKHLLVHGIGLVAAREEVGRNLQDHLAVRIICKTRKRITVNDDLRSLWRRGWMGTRFLLQRTGPLAFASAQAGMFFRAMLIKSSDS